MRVHVDTARNDIFACGVDDAVESMKRGAYDFLTKPVNLDKLVLILKSAIGENIVRDRQDQLEEMVEEKYKSSNIIGNSPAFQKIFQIISSLFHFFLWLIRVIFLSHLVTFPLQEASH